MKPGELPCVKTRFKKKKTNKGKEKVKCSLMGMNMKTRHGQTGEGRSGEVGEEVQKEKTEEQTEEQEQEGKFTSELHHTWRHLLNSLHL